jgi:RIO-like serine/threonine protein kinase
MRALGKKNLPEALEFDGVVWRLIRTHKHDFWAVTGFYENEKQERAVLKMSRTEPFAGMPLAFVGRWLCRREVRFYERLSDLPNVPALLGRVGTTGFLHAYVPGQPLSKERPVPDGFFDQLQHLIQQLHERDIAYVDANKPENILLGEDGRPHLIDFQISADLCEWGNTWLNRAWLRRLMRADIYHILKHKKRLRPDELSEQERRVVEKRSVMIRIHRAVTMPYKRIRRTTFKRLRESGRLLPEGSK